MNGGQVIAQMLLKNRTRHLFTLCGGHIGPIYVEAAKAGMQVWDVRHEASAVFAADAVSRITGIPGVATVTAGPGVTNTITAVKNAQMAQSSVLLLGGATATMLRNRGALQDIDQLSLLYTAVKSQRRVNRLRELAPALADVLRISRDNVPGPVFLECPVDLLYPEATVREWYGLNKKNVSGWMEQLMHWYLTRHVKRLFAGVGNAGIDLPIVPEPTIPLPCSADLKKIIRALQAAERPVMLLGSGAMLKPTLASSLADAVKNLGIPVYLSGMARGLLGRSNGIQFHHHRKEALREADLILLAGVPCDFRLNYGRNLNRHARKIAISRHRQELSRNIRPTLAVRADPGAFLIGLEKISPALPGWETWKKTLQVRDAARESEIEQMAGEPVKGINPIALLRQLEQTIPENSVLVADGGDFAATAAYTLRPRKPLSWLDPGVFGTLGAGGGFALGAAACYPDDYIWIIYGDGSVAYSLAEFETFAKNGLKVCGIVGNNGAWEQIARDQLHLLGADTAVILPRTGYHRVAEGYGAAGERVDTMADFQLALRRAVESMDKGVPYLINAMIGSTPFRQGSISI
ncbi:MAG: thiamine pyrophosphate-dependent enzyme [Thermoanaerobaculia bacterium]|nr:thiamine pyrophosphate-dependent enzyme [Thermoanaerobaculia bacterium]